MERKSYATSEQTKRALADALKELMAQKPFNKISIHDITDRCGMYRQNFYYHFEDVYDLLRWLIQEEAVSPLRRHEGAMLWQDGLLQLFRYLGENREFYCCALQSVGREHIRRFVVADIYDITHRTIEQVGAEIGVTDSGVKVDTDLLTHFYVVAMAGVVEEWLLGRIDRTPEELIGFADQLLHDHMRGAQARVRESRAE